MMMLNIICFLIFICVFIYLVLAALGLHCCTQPFSSCSEQGLFFIGVQVFVIIVASFVAEHGLRCVDFSGYGA